MDTRSTEADSDYDLASIGQSLEYHRDGMNVTLVDVPDLEDFERQAKARPYMGMPLNIVVEAIQPPREDFTFSEEELLPLIYCHHPPVLVPPPAATPPLGRSYPQSPKWTYVEDHRYPSRFIYSTSYFTRDITAHRDKLMVTNTPPNVVPTKVNGSYVTPNPVPGMVQMIPGVPFAYYVNGDSDAVHTVACLHTLESLKPYPCFEQVVDLSVQLAKLSWGCEAHGTTAAIPRFSRLQGLKRNDRSKAVTSETSTDGSYSLANTVLEGEGQGTVLPAVQVDSREARMQICSVLKCLNGLYRLVLPLCVSKFEFEIADFHSEINNVMSFGGLMPNGTSCQANSSSLGKELSQMIGAQGSWHTDSKDDLTRMTLFVLLLLVGPKGHPGSFCLGRPGLYVRELGAWIIFLAFKGNDIHSGFAPIEDLNDHQRWVDNIVSPAWDHAGPENRLGYVIYPSGPAIQRTAAMNVTPAQLFGNFGSAQPHKTGQLTFAKHGQVTLGDTDDWANRMGREAIGSLFNSLAQCNLDFNMDVDDLLRAISYRRIDNGISIPLKPLVHHPIRDADRISLWRGYYQHYRNQCLSLHIHIDRKKYAQRREAMARDNASAANLTVYQMAERQSLNAVSPKLSNMQIEEVLSRTFEEGKAYFNVKILGQADPIRVEEATLKGNEKIIQFLRENNSSLLPSRFRIPNIVVKPVAGSSTPTRPLPVTQTARQKKNTTVEPSQRPNTRARKRHETTVTEQPVLSRDSPSSDEYAGRGTPCPATDENENVGQGTPRPETEQEYDVEDVVGFKYDDQKGAYYEIKWVGHEGTTWEPEENLFNCLDLLKEFNHKRNIDALIVARQPSQTDPIVKSTVEKTRHIQIRLSSNVDRLEFLLDVPRLRRELIDLMEKNSAVQPKSYYANSSTSSMVSAWTDHNHIHTILGSYVNVLTDDQCSLSGILLYRLLHSVQYMPTLASDSQKLSIIMKAQRWEMCRSLMVVFDWYRDAGPRTASNLLHILRSEGYDELETHSPMLAEFINHIVWYVYQEQKTWVNRKKERRLNKKQKSTRAIPLERTEPEDLINVETDAHCSKFGAQPLDVRSLPCDFYGLRAKISNDKPIILPELVAFNGGDDELYARSREVILRIWTDEIIIPSLKQIDTSPSFSNPRRKREDNQNVLNRCLTRGAILQCLADACGTDAIFASDGVDGILASPALVFDKSMQREEVFAKKALNDAVKTLEPLFSWLTDYIQTHSTDIRDVAEQIGELIHHSMLELDSGRPLSVKEANRPKRGVTAEGGDGTQRATKPKQKKLIFTDVTLQSLLPGRSTVGIGVMGLIVREGLAAKRNLRTTSEVLRRILEGRHATRSVGTLNNPDHTNPIRHLNKAAKLLYEHLPAAKLTNEAGLANLLSWLGTGQGHATTSFLKTVESVGFYSDDAQAMIHKFQQAVSANWYLSEQRNQSSSSRFPERIVTHDTRIWGQACNHLALTPTHIGARSGTLYTLDEKFNQYFTSPVFEQWKNALGDMLSQDPSTYDGERKSWSYYHEMVKNLNIAGFKDGLTVFQLANYLVFLEIATMPHWSEVADFVNGNRQKGAFRGLEALGFHVQDSSSVRAAFYCIHDHLAKYLSEEDKGILAFSPLITEHLLCKVVRWAKHLPDFYEKGRSVENTSPAWQPRDNLTNPAAFPFPLVISTQELEISIQNAKLI